MRDRKLIWQAVAPPHFPINRLEPRAVDSFRMSAGSLPRWVWLAPLATSLAAVLTWWVWCDTERGTILGGVLIPFSGLLVLALVHESIQHRRGLRAWAFAWGVALLVGLAATGLVFVAAGLGYYLRCSPF